MAENAIARAFAKINPWSWLRTLSDNDTGILPFSGTPTNSTYSGIAGTGCLLLDVTNGALYINIGTKASPNWSGYTSTAFKSNFSTTQVTAGYAADTYLVGSSIAMPATGFTAGMRYRCMFDLIKTAAGTATLAVNLRIGTAGSTADTAILTFTFGAGTAAVDSGIVTVDAYFRTVGSGTSAVMVGECYINHALAATGLISTGASGFGQLNVVSSGFDSTTTGTIIGLSVNGGTSFSGTNNMVQAELVGF